MSGYQSILLAVDLTDESRVVADQARALAAAFNANLSVIHVIEPLSFSYGRGLQAAPQKAWAGKPENVAAAQRAYHHRARLTAAQV